MAVMYASYSLRMEGEAIKESVVCGHHMAICRDDPEIKCTIDMLEMSTLD